MVAKQTRTFERTAFRMAHVIAFDPSIDSEQFLGRLSRAARALFSAELMLGLGVASVALFVVSLLCVSWAVRQLPEDYLLRDTPNPAFRGKAAAVRVLRNLLGAILLVLGVLMLALPGQGFLTIMVACSLLDFPRKRQLERRLLSIPRVLDTINRLRQRSGRPPLRAPPSSHPVA